MNLKNIVNIKIGGVDTKDYPDFCDAYIESAQWEYTGEWLTENELNELNENYGDFIYEVVVAELF